MLIIILLSCFTIMVSAVPARPLLLSQGGATQATNQQPDAQTPAPLSPKVEQPQPGVPQGGPQFLSPTHYYTWSPLGGSPMIIPVQQSVHGSQTFPQQPLILPPYGYSRLFSLPYRNQLFSPYGYPMILSSPLQQTAANQPPNSLVSPAQTPPGAAPLGNSPQPIQQQQNPQIVYMLQQPMNPALGSLSSEELQMSATMGQLGVYLPSVLTNPSAGAVQPVNQAAGLTNPEEQGTVPTLATPSAGVLQTQGPAGLSNASPQTLGPASSGTQPTDNSVPVGLESPTQTAATVRTPAEPKREPTLGELI